MKYYARKLGEEGQKKLAEIRGQMRDRAISNARAIERERTSAYYQTMELRAQRDLRGVLDLQSRNSLHYCLAIS